MKLTFKKREVKNLAHLQDLVTENAEVVEPGFRVIAQSLNLGRSTVDLAGLDSRHTPVLIALGFTADDQMLFRMLEAYAWCLEYPECVRRLVPVGEGAAAWPPRVVFVGERVLESFLRKIGLLKFPAVDCFEFRCVEVNGATGFYLDAVDWAKGSSATSQPRPGERRDGRCEERRESAPTSEGAVSPVNGQNGGGERAAPPRWLELITTPAELGSLTLAPEPEEAPAPAERAGEPDAEDLLKLELAKDLGAKNRSVLEGLDLPPNRELAPTWRKFLEKLTGTFESWPEPRPEDAAPAPAPQPPAPQPATAPQPARNGAVAHPANPSAPAEEISGKHRALPDGLTLPANAELAPQWRKFLDKPSIDDAKIAAVREYLHREFPLCTIYDFHEFQRSAQVFQLQDNHGKVSQLATISADFFEARRDSEIRPWLEKQRLAQSLRQAGQAGVLVTTAGLQIEKR